ncbi:MAG: hypothetical protein Q9176_003850 [Flavoplaca citrina]
MAGNNDASGLQPITHHEGLECHYPAGLEVDPPGLEAFPTSAVTPDNYWKEHLTQESSYPRKKTPWRRKRVWIPAASLILVAVVLGAVLGALYSRRDIPKSPTATGTPLTGPSAPPVTSTLLNSSLASTAWTDNSGTGHRRLYYQDSAGTIIETVWTSTANMWSPSNASLPNAKMGSPLAASVRGPRLNDFELNLYYVDTNGRLAELTATGSTPWTNGSLSRAEIIPSANSDLTALWSVYDEVACNNCGDSYLVLAYEDGKNRIQVVNKTQTGIRYNQLDEAIPVAGSGLAVNLHWMIDKAPELRLYYQKGADGVMSADWTDWQNNDGSKDWNWATHEIPSLPTQGTPGSPMAGFTWSGDSASNNPFFAEILTTGAQGVDITPWQSVEGWQPPKAPDIMRNVQAYSGIAANGDRHVYAFEGGVVKEFVVSTDGLTWSLVGDVPTTI